MKIEKPPKKDFANHLHEYFKQNAKTLTGGFFNPLIDLILPSFHQKQFENWCNDVYETILELENNKITLEQLRNNLEFVSILKETMIIASKNHEVEKLKMLKSVVLNSLISSIPFDRKLIFTKLINDLSLSHHVVLTKLNQHIDEFKDLNNYQDIYKLFLNFIPDFTITKNQLVFILNDLDRHRLVILSHDIEDDEIVKEASRIITGYDKPELPYIFVTEFGQGFLDFIFDRMEQPLENDN